MRLHPLPLAVCVLALAGCGGDKKAATVNAADDTLPRPAAAGQSVTGMPNPGKPNAQRAPIAADAPEFVEIPEQVDVGEIDPAVAPAPIEGPPIVLPEDTMPVDPAAPPATPAPAADSRAQVDTPQ